MKLATLAKQILTQIDEVLLGTGNRRGLAEAITHFAMAVCARDGQIFTSDEGVKLDRDSLLRARKLLGIVARNDLALGTGEKASRWVSASYDPPADGDALDALEARIVVRARADFNVFAEFVSLRIVPERDRALLGRLSSVIQAPAHRQWAKLWDDPKNKRMIIMAHNECAKTRQLSILRPLFELGRDHNYKIAVVANNTGSAQNILRAIADLILTNEDVRRVFPTLKPSLPWNFSEIQVERTSADKEPSVGAFGAKGDAILGARVDLLVVDDIVDDSTSSSLAMMAELSKWFKANCETRLTEDARVIVVGTPWATGDLLDELSQNTVDYRLYKFPILDDRGQSTWPEAWPLSRIEERRRTLREVEFSRAMMLVVRRDADALFKQADVERALARGKTLERVRTREDLGTLPPTRRIFSGVDLSVGSQKRKADDSAIATIISDEASGDFTLVALESGRWAPTETKARIRGVTDAFDPEYVSVENNGAQQFFLDELSRDGLTVKGHNTSAQNKHDAAQGLPGLATAFELGKVVIPAWVAESEAGKKLLHALLFFNPADHTPDVLMSFWISFVAAKTARRVVRSVPLVGCRIIDGSGASQTGPHKTFSDAAARDAFYAKRAAEQAEREGDFNRRINNVRDLSEDEIADALARRRDRAA